MTSWFVTVLGLAGGFLLGMAIIAAPEVAATGLPLQWVPAVLAVAGAVLARRELTKETRGPGTPGG